MSSPAPENDGRESANGGDPSSLSLSASAAQIQALAAQRKFSSSRALVHSCPAQPGRSFSNNGVDGGPSFDERAGAAPLPSPPAREMGSIIDSAESEDRTPDVLVRPPSKSQDDKCNASSFGSESPNFNGATDVEKNTSAEGFEQGTETNMEGGTESAAISFISTSRRISNESLEEEITARAQEEDCVASTGNCHGLHDGDSAPPVGNNDDISASVAVAHVGADDDNVITAASTWTKQRTSPDSGGVGAVQMNEQAPQINRRFFRGLDRASFVARARIRRRARGRGEEDEEARTGGGEAARGSGASSSAGIAGSMTRAMDAFIRASPQQSLVRAHLVEEDEGEVVVAERMGFWDRRGKMFGLTMFVLVLALSMALSLTLEKEKENREVAAVPIYAPSDVSSLLPSMQPSSLPSHDPRPTLEIVQDRGELRCGLPSYQVESEKGLEYELCRAIAAVLVGDPDSIEPIDGSFQNLLDREIDLSVAEDTRTIEREVKEQTTGAGFTFSVPYFYDGISYFGNKAYVECAEKQQRFGACSKLRICALNGTTSQDFVQSHFPSDFIKVVESSDSMWNGICNVFARDRSILLRMESSEENKAKNYTVGDDLLSNEPHAVATRNNDYEFSNIINWIVHTLFLGEEKGLRKNSSLCGNTNLTSPKSHLNVFNSIYCVGNYGELFGDEDRHIMNQVNNGTSGMLYAIPFGDLETEYDDLAAQDASLVAIKEQGSLNCGVVVPVGFTGKVTDGDTLVGMSVDYCRTLAAALFDGDYNATKILTFPENDGSSFAALHNGTIDVLGGGISQWDYHFDQSSFITEFRFSMPYYYGNDDMSFSSMVTREKDVLFSLFVKCVVLSTIYAQEHDINRKNSKDMPLISFFGGNLSWALRDAVSYSGNYDEMYAKNFGNVAGEDRGRNAVNSNRGPEIHSLLVRKGILRWQQE